MKRFALIIAAMLIGYAAFAQDIITMRDGKEIRARITAIGTDTITYTLYDEDNGIAYTMMKADAVLIRYENGRNEVVQYSSSQYDPLLYGTRGPVDGIKPGMKYKELKKMYNYKEYTRGLVQHHSPGGAAVASFFIPGLGEMICGEGWRGVAFLGGWLATSTISMIGIQQFSDVIYLIGTAGSLAIKIASIVDATRVAKVKNMYERDLMRTYAFDVNLYPSMDFIKTAEGLQPTAGLTLAFRF